ncbi:hypothetical protein S40288_10713 [Stachybotrys chartarum IBT 40288]|nr:hypothetical protein S40288_10713 [Stachybotrys chartarum IBT 40288]
MAPEGTDQVKAADLIAQLQHHQQCQIEVLKALHGLGSSPSEKQGSAGVNEAFSDIKDKLSGAKDPADKYAGKPAIILNTVPLLMHRQMY